MKKLCGARNTVGFSTVLERGILPPPSHLPYEGIFNELKYGIGKKTQKTLDMSFGYSRFQFTASHFDSTVNDYLAMFLKGKSDGEDRSDDVRLNMAICLDVSGSMSSNLGGQQEVNHRTKLDLSLQAIRMLISKLKSNDSISFVTFNYYADVIFDQRLKKDLGSEVYQLLNSIRSGGGTSIISGFEKSKELLLKWIRDNKSNKRSQNRIIMLADVCDNSLSSQKKFLEEAANQDAISTSIIGISSQFKSEICEGFKDIKGFNYFCAVKQEDIKKYVFETFDFGFFPSATNIEIHIDSPDIAGFQVFGTTDSDKVGEYRQQTGQGSLWLVSKMKSCFPSEVEIHGDTLYTIGGLILLKLQRKSKDPFFGAKINLAYNDPDGHHFDQTYNISYEFHPEEQFFSNASLRQAIQGFVFTSELRSILKESGSLVDKHQVYNRFWPMLCSIENLCPKSKLTDLANIKKIVKSYEKEEQKISLQSAK